MPRAVHADQLAQIRDGLNTYIPASTSSNDDANRQTPVGGSAVNYQAKDALMLLDLVRPRMCTCIAIVACLAFDALQISRRRRKKHLCFHNLVMPGVSHALRYVHTLRLLYLLSRLRSICCLPLRKLQILASSAPSVS